jgi:hypothetical protein
LGGAGKQLLTSGAQRLRLWLGVVGVWRFLGGEPPQGGLEIGYAKHPARGRHCLISHVAQQLAWRPPGADGDDHCA